MFEFLNWWKTASFDEILLLLFIFTGLGFAKVLLYVGKNVTETTTKNIDTLCKRLDKIDDTLTKLWATVTEIHVELKGEISRIETRVAVTENELKHSVERRQNKRGMDDL